MATPGQLQMYNKLETGEMFGLDHRAKDERTGEIHRIHVYDDDKVPDAKIFHIWLEDHTLGNLLRMELLRNELVLFAGYKVPHPYNYMIEMRVQTLPKSSPEKAVRLAVANLRTECRSMLEQFDEGVAKLREQTDRNAALTAEAAPGGAAGGHRPSPISGGDGVMDSDPGYSPSDEGGQRFQDQLEAFERMAVGSGVEGSFSPSYLPTSPGGGGGGAAGGADADGDEQMAPP
eukprot:gb/GFBE01016183.1/.p1 GENE.gb/GFBE01016183.1/~~gb/GFBE01016183.1/.p1  ORF type:complete len:232 (+),score=36.69 gb/GFBE01016183.1/:1-696(+)